MNRKQVLLPASNNTAIAPYSPGLAVGDMVFVSGQGPLDFQTMQFELGDVADETRLTIRNVAAVLAEADCTLNDVVKATIHLARIDDFAVFNRVYQEFFETPYPARTTVQSVLGSGISVEIDVIAIRGCGQS